MGGDPFDKEERRKNEAKTPPFPLREVLWGKCISNLFSRKKKGKGGEGVLEFIIFLKEKKKEGKECSPQRGVSPHFLGGRGG